MVDSMTYRELKTVLESLTPDQLNMDVTVLNTSDVEFYPVKPVKSIDVWKLDENHPYRGLLVIIQY